MHTYIHPYIHPYIHTYPLIYPQSPFVLPIKWLVLPPLSPMKQPDPITIGTGRVDLQPGWVCSDWTDGIQYQWYMQEETPDICWIKSHGYSEVVKESYSPVTCLITIRYIYHHQLDVDWSNLDPPWLPEVKIYRKPLDMYWVHGFLMKLFQENQQANFNRLSSIFCPLK